MLPPWILRLFLIASLPFFLLAVSEGSQPEPLDIVLASGRVIDPESKLDAIRHVGIRQGKIVAVSEQPLQGKQIIDAKGLVIAPGFIDLHSHAQSVAGMRMQAFDGVTTALELESGRLPISAAYQRAEGKCPINYGFSSSWAVARLMVLDGYQEKGDIEALARGFAASGWQRYATKEESQKVLKLIEEGLQEGGIGVGMLLGYGPESNNDEYYAIARLAKKYNVPVFTHIRYLEPYGPKNSLSAHQELIALAAMTGAHMHICHLNSTATRRLPDMIEGLNNARARGLRITFEAYPYGGGSTMISAVFLAPKNLVNLGIQPSDIIYLKTGERIASLDRLAELRAKDPKGAVIVFLLNEGKVEDMALLNRAVLHKDAAIASDAGLWQVDGKTITDDVWPLPAKAAAHPRSAGCFTRILGRYVRDQKKLTLMEAIRRCSLLPTQILESVPQMKHKGRVQVGADADLIVFDPEKVLDRATYEQPNQTAAGMQHVLVNGTFVIRAGELVRTAFPGRAVRRVVK